MKLLSKTLCLGLFFPMISFQSFGQSDTTALVDSTYAVQERDSSLFDFDENEDVYLVVDKSPRFPGCEDVIDERTRFECANKEMLNFVYSNIVYPEEARAARLSGICVVQYIVTKKGEVKHIVVVRDIGKGCGAEAKRVVEEMAYQEKIWSPGTLDGMPVHVKITLPVRFKLTP